MIDVCDRYKAPKPTFLSLVSSPQEKEPWLSHPTLHPLWSISKEALGKLMLPTSFAQPQLEKP